MSEPQGQRRNPLLPWWIGLVIIVLVEIYTAYRIYCLDCGALAPLLAIVLLGVIPVIYLALMYLTLKSQAQSERE